jgi:hypothetical protein
MIAHDQQRDREVDHRAAAFGVGAQLIAGVLLAVEQPLACECGQRRQRRRHGGQDQHGQTSRRRAARHTAQAISASAVSGGKTTMK